MANNAEQFFTDSELSANDERKRKLFQLIASGDAILMVGAGSSKICGFPLWTELLEIFENKILEHNANFQKGAQGKSNIEYAAALKTELGVDRYNALINKIFGDATKTPSQCHSSLVGLPFRAILTTNFDWVLEYALNEKLLTAKKFNTSPSLLIDASTNPREVYKFLRGLNGVKGGAEVIAHLHGDYKNIQSVVLCASDYKEKYGVKITDLDRLEFKEESWTLSRKILWSLISTRRLVYVGFSMNDDYFKIMHKITCDDLGSYEEDTHYLIERVASKGEAIAKKANAAILKERYAVETVFYEENSTGNGLEQFIYEIEKEVLKIMPTVPVVEQPVNDKKTEHGDEKVNKQLMKKALQNSDEN